MDPHLYDKLFYATSAKGTTLILEGLTVSLIDVIGPVQFSCSQLILSCYTCMCRLYNGE